MSDTRFPSERYDEWKTTPDDYHEPEVEVEEDEDLTPWERVYQRLQVRSVDDERPDIDDRDDRDDDFDDDYFDHDYDDDDEDE